MADPRTDSPETQARPIELVISYADEDIEHVRALERQLTLLEERGALRVWHRGRLRAGERVAVAEEKLAAAQVIVLLVSADYHHERIAEARAAAARADQGACVVPVLVRETLTIGAPYEHLAMLPRSGDAITGGKGRDRAWAAVVKDLLAIAGVAPARPVRSTAAQAATMGSAAPSIGDPARSAVVVERRLQLRSTDSGLEGVWISPHAVSAPFPVPALLTASDQAEHRWYLEESVRWRSAGDSARARAFEQRLGELGRDLYRALRSDADTHPLAELGREGGPGAHRLFTIASDDAAALSLPWELVQDASSPLLLRDITLRRQLLDAGAPRAASAAPIQLPLRILWIVSRPTDVAFVDPRSSLEPALDALDALGSLGGLIDLQLCAEPTLDEVERRLDGARREGRPFHLVHFDGHGEHLPDLAAGVLYFERPDFTRDPVEGARFGDLLARHNITAALLEACQTSDVSGSVFGSVAPALLRAGAGSVIALSHPVTVGAARVFVRALYEALCQGDTIGQALGAARRALRADPVRADPRGGERRSLMDWHVPQLYQAGADPALVPGGARARGPSARRVGLLRGEGFSIKPVYGFRGRGRELLDLERALRRRSAVLLHGAGGTGKTSLAVEAARWWARAGKRVDGAVFTSFEARPSLEQVVRSIGEALDGGEFLERSELDQRARAVELFRTREVLWIWDKLEPVSSAADGQRGELAALFRDLVSMKPARPRGWLMVTGRPGESGLMPIAEIELRGLSKAAALDLAREILSLRGAPLDRPGYDREAIERLLAALGHHPLSIERVAPHLKTSPPADVQRDIARLLDVSRIE